MTKRPFWIAVLLALSLCACQELPPVNEPEEKPQQQEEEPGLPGINDTAGPTLINAEIPPVVSTKVALTAGEAPGLALAWEKGDCLRINGELFTIVEEGMTPSKAGFTGKSLSGDSFTVIYPGTFQNESDWNSRSYRNQVQTGNGSTDHLSWNAKVSGLSSYGAIVFASQDGQAFMQNGVIKFTLKLPDRFSSLESITLTLPSAVIPVTNDAGGEKVSSLSVGLKDLAITEKDRDVIAYLMVSPEEIKLEPWSEYVITLKGGEQTEDFVKTVGEGGLVFGDGRVTVLSLDAQDTQESLFWAGEGTASAPYQIKTLEHLQNMNDYIVEQAGASKLYFKLVDDIDMEGVDWLYKNNSINNNYPIDFNGGGHTISNFSMTNWSASFFGALKGAVYDVVFKDATIITNPSSASRGGLLAYRAGDADSPVHIHDVTVDGLSVTGMTAAVGGLVGALTNGVIENCSVKGLVLSAQGTAGGIAGEIVDAKSTIRDCSVSGMISFAGSASMDTYMGGIVGKVADGTISRSISLVSINGSVSTKIFGGIAGGATGPITIEESAFDGSISGLASQGGGILGRANQTAVINNCYSAGSLTADSGYSGCILGYAASDGNSITISNCYSRMAFTPTNKYSANACGGMIGGCDKATKEWAVCGLLAWHDRISLPNMGNTTYGVIIGQMHSGASSSATSFSNCWYRSDMDFSVKGAPRTIRSDEDITSGGKNSYDGKPADAGETCSQKAMDAGWSSDIWDFGSEYPVLKNLPNN